MLPGGMVFLLRGWEPSHLFVIYNSLASIFVASASLLHRVRLFMGNGLPGYLDERLGKTRPSVGSGRCFIINAVSVGEVAEAGTLINALVKQVPDLRVVITTGNRDGRARAVRLAEQSEARIEVQYLPWDKKENLSAWLQSWRPEALIAIETEIWPNLFRTCKELGIPVFMVNARVYPKDVRRYRIAKGFFASVLAGVEWIGTQSRADFERFIAIGADRSRLEVVGNLKLEQQTARAVSTDRRFGILAAHEGQVIVAGSTHPPEERWILDAFVAVRKFHPAARLVLAPRHVDRSQRIQRLARARGLDVARWSSLHDLDHGWAVLVLDQVGWLQSVYRFASVAVIGGSFVRHGGHNIAEAAGCGCAVLIGPNVGNFQEMVDEFHREGGVVKTDLTRLTSELVRILTDKDKRESMSTGGRKVILRHSGCSDRYAMSILNGIRASDPARVGPNDRSPIPDPELQIRLSGEAPASIPHESA